MVVGVYQARPDHTACGINDLLGMVSKWLQIAAHLGDLASADAYIARIALGWGKNCGRVLDQVRHITAPLASQRAMSRSLAPDRFYSSTRAGKNSRV